MGVTKENIIEFMKKYNIAELPLFTDKDQRIGKLTIDGVYKEGAYDAFRFSSSLKQYQKNELAFEYAISNFPTTKELYEKWNEVVSVSVDEYVDYEKERTHEYKDTLDKIFDKFDKANNKLRYCNGHHYSFQDEHYKKLYRYWSAHIPFMRSFNNYYLGSIVD